EREILSVISKLVERDAQRNIQPQDVLLALNRRANCHGCFPLIAEHIAEMTGIRSELIQSPSLSSNATPPTPRPRRRGGAFARRNTKLDR
ncbi:MAG: hypothetical protein ACR2O4_15155, partial [Hyphomicrobiaceae bacterium]